jgi:hypothetical protein
MKKAIKLALESDDYRRAVEGVARDWKRYCNNRDVYGYYGEFVENCAAVGRKFQNALLREKGDCVEYFLEYIEGGKKGKMFAPWRIVRDDAKRLAKTLV